MRPPYRPPDHYIIKRKGGLTQAGNMLLIVSNHEPKGLPHPFMVDGWKWQANLYRKSSQQLLDILSTLTLVCERGDGPRGGSRWHLTELGQTVVEVLRMDTSIDAKRGILALLGVPRLRI